MRAHSSSSLGTIAARRCVSLCRTPRATACFTADEARQRAEEWERRAKEAEGELEVAQSKLDEVEQSHSQLDADYSLVKLQLEERDAAERLDKVRRILLRLHWLSH